MNSAEASCINSRAIFEKSVGAFIDQVDLDAEYNSSRLRVTFRQVPDLGEVVITLDRVRNFRLDIPSELGGSFIDSVEAIYLPQLDQPWPTEAEKRIVRFKGLPDLIWFKLVGPTTIDVICEAMSVGYNSPETT